MIEGQKVLALIPARGGSKGLPRKNLLELNGKPLLGWPIMAAQGSKYVDKIIVSTEDKEIAQAAIEHGAEVPFMRPVEISSDYADAASVILHALRYCQEQSEFFQYLVFLEPTSPLTESSDIDISIERLDSKRDVADSIVGICRLDSAHPVFNVIRTEEDMIKPYIGNAFRKYIRRQDISDVYYFEGSLYISCVNAFMKEKTFYHDRTLPYIVPKWKSFEVDDIVDFICIEAIMNNLSRIRNDQSE